MFAQREAGMVPAAELDGIIRSAILDEVYTTPKPGLVDRRDNGAHRDMDVPLFEASADAVTPYISKMFYTGFVWKDTPERLFQEIRRIGIRGEKAMLQATNGVNTHKGLIFTMGILAASSGLCKQKYGVFEAEKILSVSSLMTKKVLEEEFARMEERSPATNGERLYARYRERGIRGQAQKGFPVVGRVALPLMRRFKKAGADENRTNINILLTILTVINDTNVWGRSSYGEVKWLQDRAEAVLKLGGAFTETGMEELRILNQACIYKNVSPGGAADLLAATLFLFRLEELKQEG